MLDAKDLNLLAIQLTIWHKNDMSWKSEEKEAFDHLKKLNLPNVAFKIYGNHNPNIPDIKVLKKMFLSFL